MPSDRIRKRLGGERHKQLRGLMEEALVQQEATGLTGAHDAWIQALLQDYYDPMYDYQLSQKEGRILVGATTKPFLTGPVSDQLRKRLTEHFYLQYTPLTFVCYIEK